MLVTPLPGVSRDDLLKTLREIRDDATRAANGGGGPGATAYGNVLVYLDWANRAARMLDRRVSPGDIDRLVLTRGHEQLLSGATPLAGPETTRQRVLNGLLDREIRERIRMLEDAVQDLEELIGRWPANAAYAVADTGVYLEHRQKLRDLDFAALLPGWADRTVRLVVPIIVMDELDRLKRTGDPRRRWRAGYTLAVMEDAFATPRVPGLLREPTPDGTRGAVILDLLLDTRGHMRLPISDDEIIDRALAAQGLAGTPVTLLTFDTGQAMRAQQAGLRVNKFTVPIGEEPPDTRDRKAKRQASAGQRGNGSIAAGAGTTQ